jgi:hypothetical protein
MMPRPRLQEEFAYQPPVLKKVASPAEKFLQAALVAVVGTGLGIGVGVFLAGRTLSGDASAAVSSTPASVAKTATTVVSTQSTAKIAPVEPAAISASGEKETSVAKAAPVSEPSTVTQSKQPRIVRASLSGLRSRHRRHGLRHRAALAAIAFPKPKAQPLVEEAKLEIPDGRFRFTIEGDQTAVAYDAQSGVVSTDGPGLFVLEKAPGDAIILRPPVTPANVHYKCDQDANCSLIMASIVVPHARMRTVSHTTDWAYVPVSTDSQAHDGPQAPVYFGHVSR